MLDILDITPIGIAALFVRFFVAMKMVPMMDDKSLPVAICGGLSAAFTAYLIPTVDFTGISPLTPAGTIVLLFNEAATGLLLGVAARFCWAIIGVAGGLTNKYALTAVPEIHTEFYGKLYLYLGLTIFFLSGGHHSFVLAAKRSVEAIPVAGNVFLTVGGGEWGKWILNTFTSAFVFGILVTAPVWVAGVGSELLLAYGVRLFGGVRTPVFLSVRAMAAQIIAVGFLWKTVSMLVQFPIERLQEMPGGM